METKKCLLTDMVVMRVIAVLLLIAFHALAPFNHSWRVFNGFVEIPLYQYLADFVYVIFLAIFVFISGYIFAYQIYQRGRSYSFGKLIGSKAKRLLLPAIIFGIIYIALFWNNITFDFKLFESIVSGVGHLWFLPMLFWCFVFGWLIDKIRINEWVKFAGLFFLTFLAALPDHLGLINATRWLVYFYVGMQVCKNKDAVMNWLTFSKSISLLFVFFFVFVFCENAYPVLDKLGENSKFWLGGYYFVKRTGVFVMSLSVCIGLFGILNNKRTTNTSSFLYEQNLQINNEIKNGKLPHWMLLLNDNSMGVYIFQQFVLVILYYKTDLPLFFGPYVLPWFGVIVTLLLSLALSVLLRKTKFGRSII